MKISSLDLLWALQLHTQRYGRFKKTMNSGVCVKGSCYDDNERDYYGMLKEVVRLKYLGSKCKLFMFKCNSLQDLTVLPTEFFRRCKTHIPSVINLPTESPTEMLRR